MKSPHVIPKFALSRTVLLTLGVLVAILLIIGGDPTNESLSLVADNSIFAHRTAEQTGADWLGQLEHIINLSKTLIQKVRDIIQNI